MPTSISYTAISDGQKFSLGYITWGASLSSFNIRFCDELFDHLKYITTLTSFLLLNIYSRDDVRLLINLLTKDPVGRDPIIADPKAPDHTYELLQLAGLGGSSAVYIGKTVDADEQKPDMTDESDEADSMKEPEVSGSATDIPKMLPKAPIVGESKSPSKFKIDQLVAIKVYKNDLEFENDTNALGSVKSLKLTTPEIIHYCRNRLEPFIVMPVYNHIVDPPFPIKGSRKYVPTLRNFIDLFEDLDKLHAAGYVHCDIRAANVMAKGKRLFFIDYGFSRRIGEKGIYKGTIETASQRILRILYENDPTYEFEVTIRDDLESFLKLVLSYIDDMELYWESYRELYDMWNRRTLIVKNLGKYADAEVLQFKTDILEMLKTMEKALLEKWKPFKPAGRNDKDQVHVQFKQARH